ncbi:MAG: hypothetical protein OEZ51_08950 [Nitrospinota bacterium]|nr:hypothetical protein [Nitrospinota bacterium]
MKKLITILAGMLLLTVWVAESWAHGPGGFRTGIPGYGNTRPQNVYPPHHRGFSSSQYDLKLHRWPVSPYVRYPYAAPSQRLPRIENGILYSKPNPLQKKALASPQIKSFHREFGLKSFDLKNNFKRNQPRNPPFHFSNPNISADPDPWFLYGNGQKLRQMGLIPQSGQ